ncbi:MAG: hypothetical protein CMH53_06255 [Myxococcales bacterium]|nr:hypothetical protein [Myxococcales bacterium]
MSQTFRWMYTALCVLVFVSCGPTEQSAKGQDAGGVDVSTGTATWHGQVRSIIESNCVSCHSPSGIAPFELDNYTKAAPLAAAIGAAVHSGRMPPWMPDKDCQNFMGDRRLSQADKDSIASWVAAGAPQGDPKQYRAPTQSSKESLERVDLELELPISYQPKAGEQGQDDYHCFVLDPKFDKATDLRGLQVIPENKVMAHHAILWAVDRQEAAQAESAPGQGWSCYGGPGVSGDMIGGWVPGTSAMVYPKGTAIALGKDQVFVVQMHYSFASLLGKPAAPDRSRFQFHFAKEPMKYKLRITPHASTTFAVPASAQAHEVNDTLQSWDNLRLWGVIPHMHQFGRSIDVQVGAGADKRCLVNIPKWDFNWQQLYLFNPDSSVVVDNGEPFRLRCVFDNPTSTTLTWGEDTTDEMCLNYYIYSFVRVDTLDTCITKSCQQSRSACVADGLCKSAYFCAINCDNEQCSTECGAGLTDGSAQRYSELLTCAFDTCVGSTP